METAELLDFLALNKFDPVKDNELILPDYAGLYFICFKQGISMPHFFDNVTFTKFNGYKVLYIGIAGSKNTKRRSLRKRDYADHFESNNSGKSTLRKSLGVLFQYRQIPRDKDPLTGKTKFSKIDEQMLTNWMKQSLVLFYTSIGQPEEFEARLIDEFNPPLNLRNNHNTINSGFRENLLLLRSQDRNKLGCD